MKLDAVADAPTSPGIYAWFALPPRGLNNLASGDIGSDVSLDRLENEFWRRLRRYPYKGRFSSQLAPCLEGDLAERTPPGVSEKVLELLADNPTLIHVLRGLPLSFMTPVYIGKAQNLRERLGQHRRALLEGGNMGPATEADRTAVKQFYSEVDSRGIEHGDLRVDWHETPGLKPEHLEYVLNRIVYPAYGRR